MAASRGNFERPLGHALADDISKVGLGFALTAIAADQADL